ncbi:MULTISPECIES: class I SAM-dependent methyltransferase [Aerosakkonema]|uniref:class I SAM-dependent methyltransferase n=1 Tax=Aerosakkonema TaxID=1246629 RepID=UPI0035BA4C33
MTVNLGYDRFDTFAAKYDFMATLLSKQDFFLTNLSERKGAALDIGCGSGILAFELAKYYETVVGIDISEEMVAIARSKRASDNIEYICMDANCLAWDKKFDLIVSSATFHHLQDLTSTLQAIKNLLNPAGKIVLRDNVSEVETPATIVYIVGAMQDFIPDCLKYGLGNATRLFELRTSKPWLGHLASDRYLSAQQFQEIYSRVFPNCSLTKLGCFMGVIWSNI